MFLVYRLREFDSCVISTEGRNHTRNSKKIGTFLYGNTSVISPFGRNDKLDLIKKSKKKHKQCQHQTSIYSRIS